MQKLSDDPAESLENITSEQYNELIKWWTKHYSHLDYRFRGIATMAFSYGIDVATGSKFKKALEKECGKLRLPPFKTRVEKCGKLKKKGIR